MCIFDVLLLVSCPVYSNQTVRVLQVARCWGGGEEGSWWGKMGKLATTPSLGLRRAAASTVRRGGPSRACVQHLGGLTTYYLVTFPFTFALASLTCGFRRRKKPKIFAFSEECASFDKTVREIILMLISLKWLLIWQIWKERTWDVMLTKFCHCRGTMHGKRVVGEEREGSMRRMAGSVSLF